jgi:hypothetical protein
MTILEGYTCCELWSGTFEDNLSNILQLNKSNNLFIYIDPYGIKSLGFQRFRKISTVREKNTKTAPDSLPNAAGA